MRKNTWRFYKMVPNKVKMFHSMATWLRRSRQALQKSRLEMQTRIKQLCFCRGHMNSNVLMSSVILLKHFCKIYGISVIFLKYQETFSGQWRLICMKLSPSPKLTTPPFIKTLHGSYSSTLNSCCEITSFF